MQPHGVTVPKDTQIFVIVLGFISRYFGGYVREFPQAYRTIRFKFGLKGSPLRVYGLET